MTEQVNHFVSEEHPHTQLFEMREPSGCVVYRTDSMEQAVCSPEVGALLRAVLSGDAAAEELPEEVRRFVFDPTPGPPLSETHRPATSTEHLDTLYVMPTLDCQLRCTYCRITRQQGQQEGFRLSPEAARKAIDRFLDREPGGEQRNVTFFGGEPLLVPDTVFSAIAHIRSKPYADTTRIMIQTNAVAIDDAAAEFLAANDVFVLVSLDGPADVQDRHRVFASGAGSYEQTVRGYRTAQRHGCRVGISATVTKETADWFASSFAELLDELRPDEFGIGTHLHPLSRARSPHQCTPEQAAEILVNAYVAARERGIPFIQMSQRIVPFVTGVRRRYSCAGCGGKVVVAPNGTAGICEYNAPEGRSFVPLEHFSADTVPDFPQWATRSPLETSECLRCPALAVCGGGCAYDSQIIMGDALKFDPWLCRTNVLVVHWMARELLSRLGHSLNDGGFHVVTRQERAALLGNIPADIPVASPADAADRDPCEECACAGKCCSD